MANQNHKDILIDFNKLFENVKPKKKGKTRPSQAVQIANLRTEGKIDLNSPDSILVHTNLRSFLNKKTFSSLPLVYQYNLVQMLPKFDQIVTPGGWIKPSSSALNNEFFAKSCQSWLERLADGKLTSEAQQKRKAEVEKGKSKLDPWKIKNFEPIWGETLESQKHTISEYERIPKSAQLIGPKSQKEKHRLKRREKERPRKRKLRASINNRSDNLVTNNNQVMSTQSTVPLTCNETYSNATATTTTTATPTATSISAAATAPSISATPTSTPTPTPTPTPTATATATATATTSISATITTLQSSSIKTSTIQWAPSATSLKITSNELQDDELPEIDSNKRFKRVHEVHHEQDDHAGNDQVDSITNEHANKKAVNDTLDSVQNKDVDEKDHTDVEHLDHADEHSDKKVNECHDDQTYQDDDIQDKDEKHEDKHEDKEEDKEEISKDKDEDAEMNDTELNENSNDKMECDAPSHEELSTEKISESVPEINNKTSTIQWAPSLTSLKIQTNKELEENEEEKMNESKQLEEEDSSCENHDNLSSDVNTQMQSSKSIITPLSSSGSNHENNFQNVKVNISTCTGNHKPMVECKKCGAFCHDDDCIGPMKLCFGCLCLVR